MYHICITYFGLTLYLCFLPGLNANHYDLMETFVRSTPHVIGPHELKIM